MKKIESFQKSHRFLSNFWDCEVRVANMVFPTAEHAYQAMKSIDLDERERIRVLETPGQAKREGQRLVIRPDWSVVRGVIMLSVIRSKFQQNPKEAGWLAMTGDAELIEGNVWHDNFWGVCTCEKCKDRLSRNLLGKILMQVRAELRVTGVLSQKYKVHHRRRSAKTLLMHAGR